MKTFLPKKLRPGKTWIVLSVALGVGLLAALVAQSYLSNQMAKIEALGKGDTVKLVVAKLDIKPGERLSSANLAVREIPTDYAYSTGVKPADFNQIDGRTLNTPIKAGEAVLWGLIKDRQAPSFSSRIAPGHRAITLPIDEINSISGLLEPGDQIDLMVTLDQKGKKVTGPLLLGVRVMATGQRVADDPKSGERRQYTTVTLDADPHEARNLIVARESGRITALLRSPQEVSPPGRTGIDLASWMGPDEVAAASGEQTVPVLYGGGKLSAQNTSLLRRRAAAAPLEDAPSPASQTLESNADVAPGDGRPMPAEAKRRESERP